MDKDGVFVFTQKPCLALCGRKGNGIFHFPVAADQTGILLRGTAVIQRHGQRQNRLVTGGGKVALEMVPVIIPDDFLGGIKYSLCLFTASDIVYPAVKTDAVGYLLLQLIQIFIVKPTGFVIQRQHTSHAGEVIRIFKVGKQVVQISVGQTVGIDKDADVIGQTIIQAQLVQIGKAGGFKKNDFVKPFRKPILPVADDGEGKGYRSEMTV